MRVLIMGFILGLSVLATGCRLDGDDPAWSTDRYGVRSTYYHYPTEPYHEDRYYFHGTAYSLDDEHHHGYGSGY